MAKEPSTTQRAWRLAYAKVMALDGCWDDAVARQRALLECRRWLAERRDVPHLARLAHLLVPEMTRRQLEAVIVPIESRAARSRVTDANLLAAEIPADATSAATLPLVVVADSLRSAFNVGGLFRSAECFGAEGLLLCGYTPDPHQPQVAAAALGAERLVPWQRQPRLTEALAELRRGGRHLVALETDAGAPPLADYRWHFPCALLLGNERFGIDPAAQAMVDETVRIPLHGRKSSLNVVCAAAIALHAARRAFDVRGNLEEI